MPSMSRSQDSFQSNTSSSPKDDTDKLYFRERQVPFRLVVGFLALFSAFSIVIFISGTNYGMQMEKKKSPTTLTIEPKIDSNNRQRVLVSKPEDFFPVAEFRRSSAILIGCHNQIRLMPQLFGNIAKAISGKVPIFGIVSDESQARAGVELIRNLGLPPDSMRFLVNPSDSIWIRDYAPFILRYDEENTMMVDAKYRTRSSRQFRRKDEMMGIQFAKMLNLPVRSIPLLLEGGNMISNGDGLLLTSSKTLSLNKNGDNGYNDQQLVNIFSDYLGVNGVFAVAALDGEPNGHIDMFMTMLSKNLAVIAEISPSVDPVNSARLNETARFVSKITTSSGPIVVKRIPMPPKWGDDWRSYTNVIFANGTLLMPSFSDVDPAVEQKVMEIYQSSLPEGWEVKKVNCDQLVNLHGQLHCISYNLPGFLPIDALIKNSYPKKPLL